MSWISVGSSTRDPQYLRSQPAQNAPPSPQSTATAASASRSNAVKASTSASALSGSMALRACGREWITVHTLPFFSILTVMATSSIDWYFDFVSPYSYLCFHRLAGISPVMIYKPVLFAGLLEHWGQKGPAEAVRRIFDAVWTTGADAAQGFPALCKELDIERAAFSNPEIKDALRKNTEQAAARGVFGVPSFVVDGEVFWGADSIEFLKAFLADPAVLRNAEMRRLDALPVAAARKS